MFCCVFKHNLLWFLVCTDDDTDDYKNKIRQNCLRAIEKAEKLKQYLTGGTVGGDDLNTKSPEG